MHFFDNVSRFSFFLAPSRSGHSVLGQLLSVHLHALFSDELDALMWIDEGFSPAEVYALIKYQNFRHGRRLKKKSGYEYRVAGSWQHAWEKYPTVIGDSKGRQSAKRIAGDPGVLPKIRSTLGLPLRVIVQARHPYAVAASEMRNRKWTKEEAVGATISDIENIEMAKSRLDASEYTVVYHEDVMRSPRDAFRELFEFLDLEPLEDVAELCAARTWNSARYERIASRRNDPQIERLDQAMESSGVFSRYLEDDDLRLAGFPIKGSSVLKKIGARLSGRV